jgi:hypothetical protein
MKTNRGHGPPQWEATRCGFCGQQVSPENDGVPRTECPSCFEPLSLIDTSGVDDHLEAQISGHLAG